MKTFSTVARAGALFTIAALLGLPASAQIGRRFPSEKKVILDPVTKVPLTFLTSTPAGDSKIYQTHQQWTADGKWLVFRSQRVPGQAFAVNEESGDIVQLTESGYSGMLTLAPRAMKLFFMRAQRAPEGASAAPAPATATSTPPAPGARGGGGGRGPRGPMQVIELNLEKLFADSAANKVKPAAEYERVCGTVPADLRADGNMGLDANEDAVYFRVGGAELAQKLPPGTKMESAFGPRGMGAGPNGLASMNLKTGEVKVIAVVPFQVGHVQTNPYKTGEIIFCWETGGKSPQRTWFINADGSGLRPLYPEAPYEWVTHEAVIAQDEVAIAVMGHRARERATPDSDWGIAGTREHPTGLFIVNLRTRETLIAGQTPAGSGLWHVHGSADGRWAVGDDFSRSLYLIDRKTSEMKMLTTGHKPSAADHPHPTFNADGTKIEIQSAMLSEDGRSMNICIVPVPKDWLARTYASRSGN